MYFNLFNIIGDGIYDRLTNEDIFQICWSRKQQGQQFENIHELSALITDNIIQYSLIKLSSDNLSCVFIAFNNFLMAMNDKDFVFNNNCNNIIQMKEICDLGIIDEDNNTKKDKKTNENKVFKFELNNNIISHNNYSNKKTENSNTEKIKKIIYTPNINTKKRYYLFKHYNGKIKDKYKL